MAGPESVESTPMYLQTSNAESFCSRKWATFWGIAVQTKFSTNIFSYIAILLDFRIVF